MSKQSIAMAANDANEALSVAKRILLDNRVQQFTGDDVVKLTAIILDRETELALRKAGGNQDDN